MKLDRTIQYPTEEQFQAFNNIFTYMNAELFENTLPHCLLNFSRDSLKVAGFFAKKRWFKNKEYIHEISLNPKNLILLEPIDVVQTIVHEMVHLWQYEFGTPSKRTYHNSEWAEKMESIGLMPSNTGKPGGKKTGEKMDDYIVPGGMFEKAYDSMPGNYSIPWKCIEALSHVKSLHLEGEKINELNMIKENLPEIMKSEIKETSNKNKIKYSCTLCGVNVWGKAGLNIICGECNNKLIEQLK